MSARELQELINTRVYLPVSGLAVECVVKNAKHSYGKTRLLILPLCGRGETWVNAASVRVISPISGEDAGTLSEPSTPVESEARA